ncbi:MAG: hypothetical protein CVU63_10745 [Deltaproteobacteria bacterium HGW-Deltaproteobacteria-20]|nr:MAG: hypothetical protein CVU63_10745 [Deltaproteobacteria bacterium HGW-Deltaproteobacteria-20]
MRTIDVGKAVITRSPRPITRTISKPERGSYVAVSPLMMRCKSESSSSVSPLCTATSPEGSVEVSSRSSAVRRSATKKSVRMAMICPPVECADYRIERGPATPDRRPVPWA